MPTRRIRHQPATLEPTLPMEPIQNPPLLSKIQEEGIIKIIPHQKGIFHIHINNYDFWTGCISPEAREEKKKEKSEVFDVFWDKYHETMQKPKQYVARARREWDKLTKEEQQTAIDHIEEVYYHTNDTRFIPLPPPT